MKKNDLLIVILVLIVGSVFLLFNNLKSSGGENLVAEIQINGEHYKTVDLTEEMQLIDIKSKYGHNIVQISNNGAEMIESDCPNHVCEETGFINKPNEMIVCLPNRLSVEIKGFKKVDIDGISK